MSNAYWQQFDVGEIEQMQGIEKDFDLEDNIDFEDAMCELMDWQRECLEENEFLDRFFCEDHLDTLGMCRSDFY